MIKNEQTKASVDLPSYSCIIFFDISFRKLEVASYSPALLIESTNVFISLYATQYSSVVMNVSNVMMNMIRCAAPNLSSDDLLCGSLLLLVDLTLSEELDETIMLGYRSKHFFIHI